MSRQMRQEEHWKCIQIPVWQWTSHICIYYMCVGHRVWIINLGRISSVKVFFTADEVPLCGRCANWSPESRFCPSSNEPVESEGCSWSTVGAAAAQQKYLHTLLFTWSAICNLHCPNDNLHSWYKCKWHTWNIYSPLLMLTTEWSWFIFIDRLPYEILYSLYMWNCLFLPSLDAL